MRKFIMGDKTYIVGAPVDYYFWLGADAEEILFTVYFE
jgi:hypothetical protein